MANRNQITTMPNLEFQQNFQEWLGKVNLLSTEVSKIGAGLPDSNINKSLSKLAHELTQLSGHYAKSSDSGKNSIEIVEKIESCVNRMLESVKGNKVSKIESQLKKFRKIPPLVDMEVLDLVEEQIAQLEDRIDKAIDLNKRISDLFEKESYDKLEQLGAEKDKQINEIHEQLKTIYDSLSSSNENQLDQNLGESTDATNPTNSNMEANSVVQSMSDSDSRIGVSKLKLKSNDDELEKSEPFDPDLDFYLRKYNIDSIVPNDFVDYDTDYSPLDNEDTDRDIVENKVRKFVVEGDFPSAFHLCKSSDHQIGNSDINTHFSQLELFLIETRGEIIQENIFNKHIEHIGFDSTKFDELYAVLYQIKNKNKMSDFDRARLYFLSSVCINFIFKNRLNHSDKIIENFYKFVVQMAKEGSILDGKCELGEVLNGLVPNVSLEAYYLANSEDYLLEVEECRLKSKTVVDNVMNWKTNNQQAKKIKEYLTEPVEGIVSKIQSALEEENSEQAYEHLNQLKGLIANMPSQSIHLFNMENIEFKARQQILEKVTPIIHQIEKWHDYSLVIENQKDIAVPDKQLTIFPKFIASAMEYLKECQECAQSELELSAINYSLNLLEEINKKIESKYIISNNVPNPIINLQIPLLYVKNIVFSNDWNPNPYPYELVFYSLMEHKIPSLKDRLNTEIINLEIKNKISNGSFSGARLLFELQIILGNIKSNKLDELFSLDETCKLEWQNLIDNTLELKNKIIQLQRFVPDESIKLDETATDNLFLAVEKFITELQQREFKDISVPIIDIEGSTQKLHMNDIVPSLSILARFELNYQGLLKLPLTFLKNRSESLFSNTDNSSTVKALQSVFNDCLDRGDLTSAQDILTDKLGEASSKAYYQFKPTFFKEFYSKIESNVYKYDMSTILSAAQNGKRIGDFNFDEIKHPEITTSVIESWIQLGTALNSKNRSLDIESKIDNFFTRNNLSPNVLGRNKVAEKLSQFYRGLNMWVTNVELPNLIGGDNSLLLPDFGSSEGLWRVCVCNRSLNQDELEKLTNLSEAKRFMLLIIENVDLNEREQIHKYSLQNKKHLVVIDESLMKFACLQSEFRFQTVLEIAQAFSYAVPYKDRINSPVPIEIFVGRRGEAEKIKDKDGCFIVYGGRRLGKTALLRFVADSTNKEDGLITPYVFVSTTQSNSIWHLASKQMKESVFRQGPCNSFEKFKKQVETWLDEDDSHRIVLLLDECNDFIKADKQDNFLETNRLVNLMNSTNKRFKCVFAGLENVTRYVHNIENSPISHYDQQVLSIGPLIGKDRDYAETLVTKIFAGMGFEFEKRADVFRIISYCLYYPILIHLVCAKLVELLQNRQLGNYNEKSICNRVIDSHIVNHALNHSETLRDIVGTFKKTLDLDNGRYRLIALIIAQRSSELSRDGQLDPGMTPRDVLELASKVWPSVYGPGNMTISEMSEIISEMETCGLLRDVGNNHWKLRVGQLKMLFSSINSIESEIEGFRDKERPPTFDIQLKRARIEHSGKYENTFSPLTSGETDRILYSGPKFSLIFGTKLAGIDLVERSIQNVYRNESYTKSLRIELFREKNVKNMETDVNLKMKDDMRKVYIIPIRKKWNFSWIESLLENNIFMNPDVRAVFIGDISHAKEWVKYSKNLPEDYFAIYPLCRWRNIEIETYLEEIHEDRGLAQEIIRECGGWNLYMSKLFYDRETKKEFSDIYAPIKKEAKFLKIDELGIDQYHIEILKLLFNTNNLDDYKINVDDINAAMELRFKDGPSINGINLAMNSSQILEYLYILGLAEYSNKENGVLNYYLDPFIANKVIDYRKN